MVPWYSKRIRMLTAFLILFIVLSFVMTGLFVWRVIYYGNDHITELTVVATPPECPVRAKAVPLATLPKSIENTLTEIERTLESKINEDTVSILANIVYMDKVIWQRSIGKMNRSNPGASELSNGTVFPIASVTKVLTALMLYKLYHQKKVKTLDDPFKKYVPTFAVKDPFDSHDITLRNLGFSLLGQGLAVSQNASYESWMKKNILDPLGMHNSGFKLTNEMRRKIPVGYLKKAPLEPLEWGWASPAGGMFTSLEDIAKLEIKLFNSTDEDDDFLSPVINEEFFSPASILDGNQFIGSPWEMKLVDGYVLRMKNGFVYGYSSNIYVFPDLKLAFNIFNTGDLKGCLFMAHKLLTAFHEELAAKDNEQQRTFSPKEAAQYVGEFHTDDVPTIRKISINYRDGKLQFSVGEYHFHLNHIAGLTFELIDRRKVKCLRIVVMGINHEKVHFDPPGRNVTSPGFTVFGFNLKGKAYFYRKRNMLS